jgi:hypothetical protein
LAIGSGEVVGVAGKKERLNLEALYTTRG